MGINLCPRFQIEEANKISSTRNIALVDDRGRFHFPYSLGNHLEILLLNGIYITLYRFICDAPIARNTNKCQVGSQRNARSGGSAKLITTLCCFKIKRFHDRLSKSKVKGNPLMFHNIFNQGLVNSSMNHNQIFSPRLFFLIYVDIGIEPHHTIRCEVCSSNNIFYLILEESPLRGSFESPFHLKATGNYCPLSKPFDTLLCQILLHFMIIRIDWQVVVILFRQMLTNRRVVTALQTNRSDTFPFRNLRHTVTSMKCRIGPMITAWWFGFSFAY